MVALQEATARYNVGVWKPQQAEACRELPNTRQGSPRELKPEAVQLERPVAESPVGERDEVRRARCPIARDVEEAVAART